MVLYMICYSSAFVNSLFINNLALHCRFGFRESIDTIFLLSVHDNVFLYNSPGGHGAGRSILWGGKL